MRNMVDMVRIAKGFGWKNIIGPKSKGVLRYEVAFK